MTTDNDFFRMDQYQWYADWVDAEVREILADTNPHHENFEFEDVPF